MKEFCIIGKIKGKQRPRFSNNRVYTPKETVNYENWVKLCYMQQVKDKTVSEEPIRATIIACFEYPKSYSKSKREKIKYPARKIDADNIAKSVLDAINNIAYKDDNQVKELIVKKRWTELEERVVVTLEEI